MQFYLKYGDNNETNCWGILFFIWNNISPDRKRDGQYKPVNINLSLQSTRLYLLSEFLHIAKSLL